MGDVCIIPLSVTSKPVFLFLTFFEDPKHVKANLNSSDISEHNVC